MQVIIGADRGTHQSIETTLKTSQYAWNSAPILVTDIFCSLAAVGWDFKVLLDVSLACLSALKILDSTVHFQYFRNVSNNSIFSQSFLQILIKKRRT